MWEDVSGAVAHPFIMAPLSSTAGSDSQCTDQHVHYTVLYTVYCTFKFANLFPAVRTDTTEQFGGKNLTQTGQNMQY